MATPAPPVTPPSAAAVPALAPELTLRQARHALDALQTQLRSSPAAEWVVDAAALRVFDSSALAVLLECRRSALAAQKSFAVRGLPSALAGLAALYGVAELLPAAA